jgi:hypothetical protein
MSTPTFVSEPIDLKTGLAPVVLLYVNRLFTAFPTLPNLKMFVLDAGPAIKKSGWSDLIVVPDPTLA